MELGCCLERGSIGFVAIEGDPRGLGFVLGGVGLIGRVVWHRLAPGTIVFSVLVEVGFSGKWMVPAQSADVWVDVRFEARSFWIEALGVLCSAVFDSGGGLRCSDGCSDAGW